MSFREEDVKPLESALAALQPAAPALQRDRLLFRAGQLAARRGRWVWPLLTVLSTGAALYLGMAALERAAAPPVREIVVVREQTPATAPLPPPVPPLEGEPAPPSVPSGPAVPMQPAVAADYSFDLPELPAPTYRHLQNQVLRWGVEALPSGVGTDAEQSGARSPTPVTSAGARPSWTSQQSLFFWRR
jgi:hypothetical protein